MLDLTTWVVDLAMAHQAMLPMDLPTGLPVELPMDVRISPNETGLPGIAALRETVGAVMTVGLVLSVLALIIASAVWAFGANSSNPHLTGKGKVGVLVSCGAAVLCGASVTLVNFFWDIGQSVS